ncbi:hypothetical protein MMC07_009326 [Pseudocyphellaria aurata]|nr:hypothetical protein [Pseudocyphellaria aurata]
MPRRASRKPPLDNSNRDDTPDLSHSLSSTHTPQEEASGPSTRVSMDKDSTEQRHEKVKEEKRRLTEEEKKKNHISSEKKRRAGIREGFDVLSAKIPGFEGMARSEGRVMAGAVEYGLELIRERNQLIAELESRGVHVDDSLRYDRWDGVITVGDVEHR